MMDVRWRHTHLDRRVASVTEVAHDSIGLYVSPPVSHLELAARVPGYRPTDLDLLLSKRDLVGLRCLRGSAFLMPADLLAVVVPATRERNARAFAAYLERSLVDGYEPWVERILGVLGSGEALTAREITERLQPAEGDRPFIATIVSQMATESHLIGVRVQASWRSARIEYTRWSDWLPNVDVESPDPEEARDELARLYLGSFGPASVVDFAWWSGLTKTQARSAIGRSGADPVDGLFDLDPVAVDPPPGGVRLLPIWDTLFVTWKDRSRFIPEALLPYVYDADGNATSVVLVDGEVAGVWGMNSDDTQLEVRAAPFGRFSTKQWAAIEKEATVVGGLAGSESVTLVRVDAPPNLREGKRNLFMRPV